MVRSVRGGVARQRRNKILKLAKGMHFSRRKHFRQAAQTVQRALHYRYKGRRLLKRDMRRLWIGRISAAAVTVGDSYSKLMHQFKKKDIRLNRKMLAELAVRDFSAFEAVCQAAKAS